MVPPVVDQNGYGLRVPGIVISPYAKRGYVDHRTLSFDTYVKFIEDDFLGGQRLDPNTDGRPDLRPDVRENVSILHNLALDFDFTQAPRPPLILPVHPATTLKSIVPFGPRIPSAAPGNGSAILRWGTPASDGGAAITGYRLFPFTGGQVVSSKIVTVRASPRFSTISGLTNGQNYTFLIAAINANGVGLRSLGTLPITVGAPAAPTSAAAEPGNGAATVSWNAPASNGSPITAYTITAYRNGVKVGSKGVDPRETSATMAGLTNGFTYTFSVFASNVRGRGPESAASGPITVGAPTMPTAVTATAGSAQATVHWTAPTTDNGSPITGYTVTPYLGLAAQSARTFTSTATTQTVTGLVGGRTYTFTVAAINPRGTSPQSAASNAVSVT
jgi:hypothetical protein